MSAGSDLADLARRSGIEHMTPAELACLREYLAGLAPYARVRAVCGSGDALSEPVVDRIWNTLGHEPTAPEYRSLAVLFHDAAEACDRAARKAST